MDLAEILAQMTVNDDVHVALIVGRDGLLIEGASQDPSVDLDGLGAMATRTLTELERMGRMFEAGPLAQMRLQFKSLALVVEPLTETDVLVAGIQDAVRSAHLLDVVAIHRRRLQQTLGDL